MKLPQTVTQIWVITQRNLLKNLRLPQLLVFATIQPVMFLLLFNYVFGGAIGGGTVPANGTAIPSYINFLLPGLLAQTALFGATQTTVGLTEDLASGSVDRFRSLPIARSAVLAGRTISDLLRNLFVVSLMIAVGFILGFRPSGNVAEIVLAVALVLGFSFAFSWVMACVGLMVKNAEAAQAAGFLFVFPLAFASSVFVPTDTMPGWLRAFAENQPVTIVVNAVRALMSGTATAGQIAGAAGWIAAISAVAIPVAVAIYRRSAE